MGLSVAAQSANKIVAHVAAGTVYNEVRSNERLEYPIMGKQVTCKFDDM